MAALVAPQPGCGRGAGREPGLGGGDARAGAGRRSLRWLCPRSSRVVAEGSAPAGPALSVSCGLSQARGEPRQDGRGRRLCLLLGCHGYGPSSVPTILGTRSPNSQWASGTWKWLELDEALRVGLSPSARPRERPREDTVRRGVCMQGAEPCRTPTCWPLRLGLLQGSLHASPACGVL